MRQVADNLCVSHSKVRYLLKKQNIPRRNRSTAIRFLNITKFNKQKFVIKSKLTNTESKLRISGIMLYWGEGTKSGNSVVFSNSDPDMIKLFLLFMRKICGVAENRLRALVHIYPDQNEVELKKFWSKVTGLSLKQFSKTFCHKGKQRAYKKISQYGTLSLRYSDKELLEIINNWIDSYRMPA